MAASQPIDITPTDLAAEISRRRQGSNLLLLLDYDGTLVPLVEDPAAAIPGADLLALLASLAATPGIEVHILSGRTRTILELWLGDVRVGLHAEHGAYSRASGGTSWDAHEMASLAGTLEVARELIVPFMVDGARFEKKELGLSWHYRALEVMEGTRLAEALKATLDVALEGTQLMAVHGSRVVEVRPRTVTKGILATSLAAQAVSRPLVVAIGDDRTDEDMFQALTANDISIHVGEGNTLARWRLENVEAVRVLLAELPDTVR